MRAKILDTRRGTWEWRTLPRPVLVNDSMTDGNSYQWGTGIWLTAVYCGPRAKRVVIRTYSIWEDRTRPGHCTGYEYLDITDDCDALDKLARIVPDILEDTVGNSEAVS